MDRSCPALSSYYYDRTAVFAHHHTMLYNAGNRCAHATGAFAPVDPPCKSQLVRIERQKTRAAEAGGRNLRMQRLMLVFIAALAAVVMVSSTLVRLTATANALQSAGNAELALVVVASGDTLWSICEAHPVEGMSTYQLVSYVQSINDINPSSLQPGDLIQIPVTE